MLFWTFYVFGFCLKKDISGNHFCFRFSKSREQFVETLEIILILMRIQARGVFSADVWCPQCFQLALCRVVPEFRVRVFDIIWHQISFCLRFHRNQNNWVLTINKREREREREREKKRPEQNHIGQIGYIYDLWSWIHLLSQSHPTTTVQPHCQAGHVLQHKDLCSTDPAAQRP